METSVRLGKVAGIALGFNWSVLLVAALITWSLSTEALPESMPDHGAGQYWAAGTVIAVLFFCSLLAHELAHSIVARHAGVQVNEITLWMLGGVSKLENEAEDARTEFRIAVVGPLTSIGLAVGFGILATAFATAGLPELVVAVPGLLSGLNLILGVFNLAPAYPLDGGRVLRAFLWRQRGDRLAATRAAAHTGRFFGWMMIGLGLVILMSGAAFSGIWLGFIGVFILLASTMELSQTEGRELLSGVAVSRAMTPNPITAPADLSVAALIDRYILRARASAYPAMVGERVVGLVTLDGVRALPPSQRSTMSVADIAVPMSDVPVATPTEPLLSLIPRLTASPVRRALVMEGDRLVGIISMTDVTRALELREVALPTVAA